MRVDPETFIISIIVIILSIALHEFGHAISADRLGDPGPRRAGRVTLWPDRHFDLLGFILIVITQLSGWGIGWGKPVMVDSRYFRNPRRDMLIVAAFGPLMNLLLAIGAGIFFRIAYATHNDAMLQGLGGTFAERFLLINLSLMFFNLLPIHPLDGGKILSGLLPDRLADQYDRFMWQWGSMILMILVLAGRGILSFLLAPAVLSTASILVGRG